MEQKSRSNASVVHEKLAISPTEAASVLSISRAKFYRMMAAGEVPCIKIGRLTRIPMRSLEEWIDARLTGTEPR